MNHIVHENSWIEFMLKKRKNILVMKCQNGFLNTYF